MTSMFQLGTGYPFTNFLSSPISRPRNQFERFFLCLGLLEIKENQVKLVYKLVKGYPVPKLLTGVEQMIILITYQAFD